MDVQDEGGSKRSNFAAEVLANADGIAYRQRCHIKSACWGTHVLARGNERGTGFRSNSAFRQRSYLDPRQRPLSDGAPS